MKNNNITLLDKFITESIINKRRHRGISAENLAETINVSGSFVRSVEAHDKKYNFKHLYLICLNYNWKLEDLIPQENYFKIKGFEKNKYSSLDELREEIKKDFKEKK